VLPDGAHLRLYFLQKPTFPRTSPSTPSDDSTGTASASVTPSSEAGGPTPVAQPDAQQQAVVATTSIIGTGGAAPGASSTANIPIPTATTGIEGVSTPALHGKRPGGGTPAVDAAVLEKQSKRAVLERLADPMCMAQTDPELLDIYADILQVRAVHAVPWLLLCKQRASRACNSFLPVVPIAIAATGGTWAACAMLCRASVQGRRRSSGRRRLSGGGWRRD